MRNGLIHSPDNTTGCAAGGSGVSIDGGAASSHRLPRLELGRRETGRGVLKFPLIVDYSETHPNR
jgi:hypothetical protein